MLSEDPERRVTYLHMGWRQIEGSWHYLHAGGAIGAEGSVDAIRVELPRGHMSFYRIELPGDAGEERMAVRASLALVKLAPAVVMFPLLSSVYRAPLAEAAPVNVSTFIEGITGCQKTELTALAQAHYGAAFNGKALPGNWNATGNSLERAAFVAKDAIFTVDDFNPVGLAADVQRMHREADRLLRGAANQAGRGRMAADGSLRPEYFARGLVGSSGEDVPNGHSLRARLMILSLRHGDVDLVCLTQAQQDAAKGILCRAMGGYLGWLASRMDQLKRDLPKRLLELRAAARSNSVHHDRVPDSVACLAVGWEHCLLYALDVGAITEEQRVEYWSRGWNALLEAAAAQAEFMKGEEPTSRFVALLKAAMNSGRAHMSGIVDERPPDAQRWGWRYDHGETKPLGRRIGWTDGADVLLDPEAAFAEVQQMASQQGTAFSVTPRTLWKRMAEKQLLVTEAGKNLPKRTVGGVRERVLHMHALSLHGMGAMGAEGADPHEQ